MDPSGSDLDSSLPQPENPCLIVEDSQPDSVALEDDPESSYRALLARRLSILQPASRSPVLELISSPLGSRSSQTDSQSTSDTDRQHCGAVSGRPVQNSRGCADMDSGADSTTNCVQSEGDSCHLGFLELSQSQDLQAEEILVCPSHTDKPRSSEQSVGPESQSLVAPRSEVSSSSSGSVWQASLQVLSHAPNASGCAERDQEILSSQEDLFDADKTAAAVDSTVSQSDQQGRPSSTPAHTLQLLHLSGQGTLVQDSPSQNSGDYVAPTPDSFPHTPLIVPSSPTESEPPNGAGDAMDTSKPHPSASTPVSQSTPGFAFDRLLPVPSQPEFSHDVFAPPQSQKASQPRETSTSSDLGLDPAPFSSLQLSESCSRQERSPEEDSQATQIEAPEEAPSRDMSTCRPESGAAEEPSVTELDRDSLDVEDAGRKAHSPPPEATPSSLPSQSVTSQPAVADSKGGTAMSLSEEAHQHGAETDKGRGVGSDEEEEEEHAGGPSGLALVLSQSQLLSPEHMEEGEDEGGERPPDKENGHAPISNSHPHKEVQPASDGTSQTGMLGRKAQSLEDKSLSDSSADISFHFTLPKDGELTGPPASATPPLVSQLGQTLRHSTPIETASFSEKSDVPAEVAGADSPSVDGKLSLRMKLVTPVEEGSSERFSLQKPALAEEDAAGVKVATVSMAAPSSPSVFTRVRQVHRQREAGGDLQPGSSTTAVEEGLSASPKRSSQLPPRGCNSLPSSQPEPQGGSAVPQGSLKPAVEPPEEQRGAPQAPEPPRPGAADPQKRVSQQAVNNTVTSTPSKGEPESPSLRRAAGPAHHRHVRTIQEVRTTVTRIITDVYYEDGREVDRRVTEESEEPVVDCQVLEEVSPCRTGSSSVTLGDLADISSLSSKASSLQHSSGGTSSSTGPPRPDFIIPPSRGARSMSPRRGGGHLQRGHRGNRVGSVASPGRSFNTSGSRAFLPMTPRGRSRRGRPPSRSSMFRGGAVGSLQRPVAHGHTPSSSEEEPYTLIGPPLLPVSPTDPKPPSRSDSLRSSPEAASSAGSSFVGLRVVAKWSSNGYFYSGRIMKDAGEGRFRLRFDDGYECEVAGRDILLCDPIPLETEVTALLEDEYFSVGVVKGHRAEGSELFYSIERDGQRHWHNRTAVILSLDQGNRLREQHSLGPYEPSTPLTKASDISLDGDEQASSSGGRKKKGHTKRNAPKHRGGDNDNDDDDDDDDDNDDDDDGNVQASSSGGKKQKDTLKHHGGDDDGDNDDNDDDVDDDDGGGQVSSYGGQKKKGHTKRNAPKHRGGDDENDDDDDGDGGGQASSSGGRKKIGHTKRNAPKHRGGDNDDDDNDDDDDDDGGGQVSSYGGQKKKGHTKRNAPKHRGGDNDDDDDDGDGGGQASSSGGQKKKKLISKKRDNLVEGKRRRRGTPGGAHTPNRSSSSSPRTPGPSGKRKLMASEENRTPSKRGRRGGGSRAAQRFTVCNTSGSGTELPGQSGDPAETHGPLPHNASLFMGFAFMLTASSETDRLSNLVFSEDEEDYVQTGPYNKAYTESQLQAGGGFILPDFNEEQCQAAYQSLLIADQHCRTRKYLLCVSSGVPCVSHIWVRDCCRENKLLNYRNYLLPAGAGPDGAIVEWHPRCSPFKALHVLLLSQQPQELWAQLATMGGASSVQQLQVEDGSDIPAGRFDVAVTDHTCPPQVRRRVTSQEVPVVPPEWLIQSLICGKRMDFRRGWDGSSSPCSSSSS